MSLLGPGTAFKLLRRNPTLSLIFGLAQCTRCRLHNLLLRFALDMGSTVPQERGAPPAKRKRTEKGVSNSSNSSARLFVPFRALGLITNHVPFVLQTRSFKGATDGPRIHILTCLGSSWAMWEGGKMTLLFVGMSGTCFRIKGQFTKRMCLGPNVTDPIACLAMSGDAVWASSGSHAIKYLRGKEVSALFQFRC